jgi:hypothetical protein
VVEQCELRLRLLRGRRSDWLDLAEIRVLDLAGVEEKIVFEDDVERGAARKLRVGTASQKHSS